MTTPLKEYLLAQYPHGCPLLTTFCEDNADLLPVRRARQMIDTIETQPPEVQRCFVKRMGRWHLVVPAFAELMTDSRMIIAA